MKATPLGSTGETVSAIGFGAMHLSLEGRPDEDAAIRVVHQALDLGVTLLDTADAYCIDERDKHHNERLLARALTAYEGDTSAVRIATKGGMTRPDGAWKRDGDPEHLAVAIRASHAALGGEAPIFLWQHHAPDAEVPVKESLQAVQEAVDEGLIRYVGVSNYSVAQLEEARAVVDLVSVQNQYSPWHRRPEEDGVLAYCERESLTFLAYSPLGGKSRAKRLEAYEDIVALAKARDVSPQRLVLAWLMAKSPCVLPIPGASRPETIADSARAAELTLTDEEVRRIDADAAA